MSEKENKTPTLQVLNTNLENNIVHIKETQLVNKDTVKNVTSQQGGLKPTLNINRTTKNKVISTKQKEANKSPVVSTVKEIIIKSPVSQEEEKSPLIPDEKRRRSTSPTKQDETEPTLLSRETITPIQLHSNYQQALFIPVNLNNQTNEIIKLKSKIMNLEKENQLKTNIRNNLLNEKNKAIQQFKSKSNKIKEIQRRIDLLNEEKQEQEEMYKELAGMIHGLNENGIQHQEYMNKLEDEINQALNQLSEINYKILEIKESW